MNFLNLLWINKIGKIWDIQTQEAKKANEISIKALIITIINIVITLGLVIMQINLMSKQTDLMQEQTSISKDSLLFQKSQDRYNRLEKSRDLMNGWYDLIHNDEIILKEVNKKIQNSQLVNSKDNLIRYVDWFDNIWNKFCIWDVALDDMEYILANSVRRVCSNKQIISEFSWKKNWLSLMCNAIYYNATPMWKIAKSENCDYGVIEYFDMKKMDEEMKSYYSK